MASATSGSLPNHCLPLLLPAANPTSPATRATVVLPRSSHSQLFGLRLSACSAVASTSAARSTYPTTIGAATPIRAKVSKGDAVPDFTLRDQDGKKFSFSGFKGKPVVLYFYPADETPGCTKQACAFRDSYEKFKKAGAEVVGISGDDPASHKAFAKKYRLPFSLLSDEGNKLRKQWGVPSDLFGTLPGRQTYVISKKGIVQLIYNNQFQPEKHVDETLKLLKSL